MPTRDARSPTGQSPVPRWQRIVLKLSGEAIAEATGSGLARAVIAPLGAEIAALRAAEIEADAILKGTHSGVDGVYTDDPKTNPDATRFDEVSYIEVLNRGLKVMDSTAITFCMDNELPIVVFDLLQAGNIRSVLEGEAIGTLVR